MFFNPTLKKTITCKICSNPSKFLVLKVSYNRNSDMFIDIDFIADYGDSPITQCFDQIYKIVWASHSKLWSGEGACNPLRFIFINSIKLSLNNLNETQTFFTYYIHTYTYISQIILLELREKLLFNTIVFNTNFAILYTMLGIKYYCC